MPCALLASSVPATPSWFPILGPLLGALVGSVVTCTVALVAVWLTHRLAAAREQRMEEGRAKRARQADLRRAFADLSAAVDHLFQLVQTRLIELYAIRAYLKGQVRDSGYDPHAREAAIEAMREPINQAVIRVTAARTVLVFLCDEAKLKEIGDRVNDWLTIALNYRASFDLKAIDDRQSEIGEAVNSIDGWLRDQRTFIDRL